MSNLSSEATSYLHSLAKRKRHPVKPSTLSAYRSYVRTWIVPIIGECPAADFTNAGMRDFVNVMVDKGLGPKSIREVVTLVKQIIGDAVGENGEQLYPRDWNSRVIDLPDTGRVKQPGLTPEMLAAALRTQDRTFYAFLAGTGLRIGEALAVRITDDGNHTGWDPLNAVVRVRTAVWGSTEQAPKTDAAEREVDLHPQLNELLLRHAVHGREYLFPSTTGGRMWQSTLRESSLTEVGIPGFHCFRRFRITRMRESGVPEDIIRYWVGHAGLGITDRYSKLAEYKDLRKAWASKSELGFEVPEPV
jgi:integrase